MCVSVYVDTRARMSSVVCDREYAALRSTHGADARLASVRICTEHSPALVVAN